MKIFKKLTSVLLALCILSVSFSVSAQTIKGDTNGDGKVNSKDSLILKEFIAVWDVVIDEAAADVNSDGTVNSKDILKLRKIIANFDIGDIFSGISTPYMAEPIDMGIPMSSDLNNSNVSTIFARNVWDMITYKGKIFIGCGDYDYNPGVLTSYYITDDTNSINTAGTFTSEQIDRFYILNGKLIAPAMDPVVGNDGEFYVFDDTTSQWNTKTVLPNNVHCFDMAYYHGKYFTAGSVADFNKYSMIMSSTDLDTFDNVWMYQNDTKLDATNSFRVYDLWVYNDILYAYHYGWYNSDGQANTTSGLYKYNEAENKFEWCDAMGVRYVTSKKNADEDYMFIQRKLEFNGKMVFVTSGMHYTDDFVNYTTVNVGEDNEGYVIRDILKIDDVLYVMASKDNGNGTFTTSLFRTSDLKNYQKLFYFDAKAYMKSFEYCDGSFYFGAGTTKTAANTESGRIYRIKLNS